MVYPVMKETSKMETLQEVNYFTFAHMNRISYLYLDVLVSVVVMSARYE